MDLTTRALLLFGVIIGLFALAGIAVVVGRSLTGNSDGESFDVGRKRRNTRKPKASKPKAPKQTRQEASTLTKDAAQVMPPASSTAPPTAFAPPVVPPMPASSVESAPPLPAPSRNAPSPFGGTAQPNEEW